MRILIFILLFYWNILSLNGQNGVTVQGTVTDKDHLPLPGAHVRLDPGSFSAVTGDAGQFVFRAVSKGEYRLSVSYIGYQTYDQAWEINADLEIGIELEEGRVLTDEIVVSALRANAGTGTTYENLDREQIEKSATGRELPFLMEMSPSVVVTSDAGQGVGHSGMRIRGSDATRINATINGIPYNDAESQGTFWLNMPDFASSVESIQIQRGVGTSTNGAGAFGASLNIRTNALNPDPYVEINNSIGSFGTLKNTVKLGTGLLDGRFVLDARLSRIKSDGYIDRAFSDLKSFYLSGGWYGDDKILRFNIISGKQKAYQAWNGIPEDILATHRTYNEFTYPDQTDNYTQTHYQLHWSQQFSDSWDWNVSLNYTPGEGYYEEYKEAQKFADYGMAPVPVEGDTLYRTDLVRQLWLDNQFYGGATHVRWQAGESLDITWGGAFFQYVGDHYGTIKWAKYASDSFLDDRFYFNDAFKNDGNIFMKTTWKSGENSIFLDLQNRWVSYSIRGSHRDGRNITQADKMSFFNPKLGYTRTLSRGSQIYASIAKGSREPNRDDYKESTSETRPEAEKLYDLEAGYRVHQKKNRFEGNLYYMYYDDQLILTGQINDVGNPIRTNVKKSYRLGVELSDVYQVSSRWKIGGNLALSRNIIPDFTEYVDVYDEDFSFLEQEQNRYINTTIAYSPSVIGGLSIAYSPVDFLTFEWNTKYVGRQFLDNTTDKSRSLRPFAYSDLRLALEGEFFRFKNILVALDLKNIFNARYESNGYTFGYMRDGQRQDFNYYYPQAGFHFLLTLNVRF